MSNLTKLSETRDFISAWLRESPRRAARILRQSATEQAALCVERYATDERRQCVALLEKAAARAERKAEAADAREAREQGEREAERERQFAERVAAREAEVARRREEISRRWSVAAPERSAEG